MKRSKLISLPVVHAVYGHGHIAEFRTILERENVGIDFDSNNKRKYFVFPYCFIFQLNFSGDRGRLT